jgi:coenzyme PQQ biosynthesis protein PqqD
LGPLIDRQARPRLAPQARLRFDAHSGKHILLYPERGLELTDTAAEVARLCTGEASVAAILETLVARYPDEPGARIEAEALAFLRALAQRGLLVDGGAMDLRGGAR